MIKKCLFACLLLLAVNSVAYAQLNVGLKGGLNLSNTVGLGNGSKTKVGLNTGVYSEIQLYKGFFLRPELIYSLKGHRFPATQGREAGSFHFSYLNLPVMIGYRPTDQLSILFGPEVGYLLNAVSMSEGNGRNLSWVEKTDLGAALGVSYAVGRRLSVELRYVYGLGHLYETPLVNEFQERQGTVKGGANRTFQANISYSLFRRD